MQRSTYRNGSKQRGMTIIGLIFVVAIVGFLMLLGFKVVPTFVEYRAIVNAINKAKATATTPHEIQASFSASSQATYIDSISGKDLIIVASPEGGFDIGFAYEKRIPLFSIASLVLDYEGSTAKGGAPLAKPAAD